MIITDPTSAAFNSYASTDDLKQYADTRGVALPEPTESLLFKAMDYLNGLAWYGSRVSSSQPLPWPRRGIQFEGNSLPSDVIPVELITAQCMLSIEAISGDLLRSSREAEVRTERVDGAVTVTYAVEDGKAFTPSYPLVMGVLNGLVSGRGFAINATARRA